MWAVLRLISRLECGLTTELHPPDFETRMAILKKKAAAFQAERCEDVLAYLAQHVRTTVRRPRPDTSDQSFRRNYREKTSAKSAQRSTLFACACGMGFTPLNLEELW